MNDPESPYTSAQRKADLLVMFLMTHEIFEIALYILLGILKPDEIKQAGIFLGRVFDPPKTLVDILENFFASNDNSPVFRSVKFFDSSGLLPLLQQVLGEDPTFWGHPLKYFSFTRYENGQISGIACEKPELYNVSPEGGNSKRILVEAFFKEMISAIDVLFNAFVKRHKKSLATEKITPKKVPFLFA